MYPRSHLQYSRDVLPAAASELLGHPVQVPDAVSEYVFTGQVVQTADEVAAVDGDAVPLSQLLQAVVPLDALYLPDEHATHTSEAGSRYPMTWTLFRMILP